MVVGILAILSIGLISLITRLGMTSIARSYAEKYLLDNGEWKRNKFVFDVRDSLQESEARYRTFFDVSADAFVILDGDRHVDCNAAALKLFGYDFKEEFYLTTPAMISPEFQANDKRTSVVAQQQIEKALQNGSTRFEWLHQRKDKTVFPTEVSLNVFKVGGRPLIQAVIRDITARKQEEADLQRSREEQKMIMNSIPFGVAIIGKDKRIRKVNKAAQKMIGYEENEELVGHICHKAFCPAKVGQCPVLDLGKTVDESEKTLITKFGKEKPILKTVTPITIDGEECLLESFVDITTQKQNEEEIKNIAIALESTNQSLEEYIAIADSATRAKGEFLANMSHEIRTPMTAILGFAELLREKIINQKELNNECLDNLDYVNTIFENGQYLLRIINDILDLSKIEAEKIEIEQTTCSPAELMDDIKSLMGVRAKAKGLPLEVEYIGALPETVYCDTTRIRQILINLLGNAIKFTEEGEIRLIGQLAYGKKKNPFLRFDVIDTGIGMSKEQVNKIFKPFEQADSSTSRKFGGTGLGLTISKRLATLLGGDLVLTKSKPDKGSTFTFTTAIEIPDSTTMLEEPASSYFEEENEKTPFAETASLDCRVLLVEDGVDNQRLISLILKQAGAEVVVAENGLVACETVALAEQEGNSFDVILMDMQMPVMDGYEATRRLRIEGYYRPIIALTAHAMAGDSNKCKVAGCDDYLTKPIDKHTFINMVAKYATVELQST